MKYKYYIAIIYDDNTIEWVTEIDNSTRMYHCKKGDTAKSFSKSIAENIAEGIIFNGTVAVVVKAPDFYNLSNK